MNRFPGQLAVQQRVLPNYRAPFFEMLASRCDGGMTLFTGLPRPGEGITTTRQLQGVDYQLGENVDLFDGSLYLCYQRGLVEWLERCQPDALIVEANPRYLSTSAAVKWMHARNKRVIGWGLGSPSRRKFLTQRRASFLRQFDAMIVYSQRGANEYMALGFPPQKIFVAHNAVSAPPSLPFSSRPSIASEPNRQPTILFVGRLQVRKRVDSLLHACAALTPKPRLVIVGDGPEREVLQSLAKEIYPRAEFVGAKHGEELMPYFSEADLFVLPGTGGLAIQEAMSHGLPVIVAQGDGTQDDLVREGNGWQVPPDDFGGLVSTMQNALSDVTRLRRMGEESYRIVKEEINIERMVETFLMALSSLA